MLNSQKDNLQGTMLELDRLKHKRQRIDQIMLTITFIIGLISLFGILLIVSAK